MKRPRISLLHATYRRAGGPLEVRDAWLGRAVDPDSVEYVVSMDADDLATVALTEGVPRLVNPSMGGEVTAVRNWNAAAAAAKGDLLVVIADDLFPSHGWDRALLEMVGRLDPARTPFVVKVGDSPKPGDVLVRHPVVSRAFYERFGLFSPSYRGVYCDDDFSARAYWRSVILDGRSLQLEHRHPTLSNDVARSESYDRLNRREEYGRGRAQYLAAWSRRHRTAERRLVPTASAESLSHWGLLVTQRKFRFWSDVQYAIRVLRKAERAPRKVARVLSMGRSRMSGAFRARIRVAHLIWRLMWVKRARRAARIVRRHPVLSSFFLVDGAATRYATLSETVGDIATVLDRLRHPMPVKSEATVDAGSGDLRILVVDPSLPVHDKASGSLRLFRILGLLREAGHHVTFLARSAGEERYGAELEAMGIVVHAGDPEPGLLRCGRFDIAWLSFYDVAEQYLPEIRAHSPSTRILIDTVDVHWLREQREAQIHGDARRRRAARVTRLREEMVYRAADGLIAVTSNDERALRRLAPDVPTYVLGNVHPGEDPGPDMDSRSGVVFVGNFNHRPNVDAALHLVGDVMPLVWATCPDIGLTIVGTNPPPAVRQLADERVTVTGHVPHTRPYLDAARVSVAPLRYGAGMKGKVGEALAAGLPVVTTPIGAEGMGLEDGVHALIADTAAELAASVVRLHTDIELWTRLSESGRREIDHRYGVDATRSHLAKLLDDVAARATLVWVPVWDDKDDIDGVLGSYADAFSEWDRVTLVVGVEAARTRSREQVVAALAASLARIGRRPESLANVAVVPFPAGRAERLLCPGAIWVPTGIGDWPRLTGRPQPRRS